MSRTQRFRCGTPGQHCTGARMQTDQNVGSNMGHGSREEAFRCYADYLVKVVGCKRVGQREFEHPNGGPIEILTKKIRFGGRMRAGKEGRYMPGDDQGTAGLIY